MLVLQLTGQVEKNMWFDVWNLQSNHLKDTLANETSYSLGVIISEGNVNIYYRNGFVQVVKTVSEALNYIEARLMN